MAVTFADEFLAGFRQTVERLDLNAIEKTIDLLIDIKRVQGRIFFLGIGGSAANCSHAVNDFRKLANIESYTPTDNAAELTARTNDDGWSSTFLEWLKVSRLSNSDLVFVLSVGGGSLERNVSTNIVEALRFAKGVGARVAGVVGRDGGYTAAVADACILVPVSVEALTTPLTESLQSVLLHLLVFHPRIRTNQPKWGA